MDMTIQDNFTMSHGRIVSSCLLLNENLSCINAGKLIQFKLREKSIHAYDSTKLLFINMIMRGELEVSNSWSSQRLFVVVCVWVDSRPNEKAIAVEDSNPPPPPSPPPTPTPPPPGKRERRRQRWTVALLLLLAAGGRSPAVIAQPNLPNSAGRCLSSSLRLDFFPSIVQLGS